MHAATLRTLMFFAGLIGPALALGRNSPPEKVDYEPLTVLRTSSIYFPIGLTRSHIDEGQVNVAVWVDDSGRLLDWLLIGYTHPLFAKAVLDALPHWKYLPSRLNGQPTFTRTELKFLFKNTEMVRVVSGERTLTEMLQESGRSRKFLPRIYGPDELDQPLDAVVEIAPRPPDQLGAVAHEGSVVVEYLIDANGKVRMPIITASDDQAFSDSVLLAITEWRYAVPKHVGHPVIARVRQKFTFSPAS